MPDACLEAAYQDRKSNKRRQQDLKKETESRKAAELLLSLKIEQLQKQLQEEKEEEQKLEEKVEMMLMQAPNPPDIVRIRKLIVSPEEWDEKSNHGIGTQFLLLGFSDSCELQIFHFLVFLLLYLAALTGNCLIITVVLDHQLHSPMCFFPMNLSISDLGSISVLVLKSMSILAFYVPISLAVSRIPSEEGQHKASSTCVPDLTVVSLFSCMGSTAYTKPISTFSSALAPVIAVLCSVLPPIPNPAIYRTKNKEIIGAVRKLIKRNL
ncbi:PREDICTED: olfactory receptor 477-like [Cariama cristata]|uniref:olfactory receptor 477-like n=1 Tax=Cariama cristata TaxID=54380 RepID=UPI0005201814|nr:PREDICTED: olfactory receptor 477-like [Cariama cristata]